MEFELFVKIEVHRWVAGLDKEVAKLWEPQSDATQQVPKQEQLAPS